MLRFLLTQQQDLLRRLADPHAQPAPLPAYPVPSLAAAPSPAAATTAAAAPIIADLEGCCDGQGWAQATAAPPLSALPVAAIPVHVAPMSALPVPARAVPTPLTAFSYRDML